MEIDLSRPARRYLDKRTPADKAKLAAALDKLAQNPRDPSLDIEPVRGEPGTFRLKVAEYRVLFTPDAKAGRIAVETIRTRGDVYKR